MRWFAIALLLSTQPAAAHEPSWDSYPWTYDPWVIGPLYLSAILYLVGTQLVWRRAGGGRGVRFGQAWCFWTGWGTLALALVSPLHWAGERLFTAHMIEHAIVMVVAAPLIAASRPLGAMFWALPRRFCRVIAALRKGVVRSHVWQRISHPFGATLVHGFAIWAWHVPFLYEAALSQLVLHRLQHVSFFLTALLFWWSLLNGRMRAHGGGIAVFCLFVTSLHTGILGILMTLSRRLWVPAQGALAAQFGLTPLEDQQLAGLVMGVPMGLVYTGAALAIAGRWIAHSSGSFAHASQAR